MLFQRQKRQIHCIFQKPDDHQAPSVPPTGYWMRLELCQELSRDLAFPVQEMEMDFTETWSKNTSVHTGVHWTGLHPSTAGSHRLKEAG